MGLKDVKRGATEKKPTFCEKATLALRVSSSVLLAPRSTWSTRSCSAWAFSYTHTHTEGEQYKPWVQGYYQGTLSYKQSMACSRGSNNDTGSTCACIHHLLADWLLSRLHSILHLPPHSFHLILGGAGHSHLPSHFCVLKQTQARTNSINIILKTECYPLCNVCSLKEILCFSSHSTLFIFHLYSALNKTT